MSKINVSNLSHAGNGGDPNIELYADGTTSIKGIQGAAVNPNLLDNSSFRTNQRNLWTDQTSGGFLCDRWSCGNRGGWSIQRGSVAHSAEGQAPFGAYCVKAGNGAVWETGVELQNNGEDQNSEFVNPVAYNGCKFVLSVWAYRPTRDIDQLLVEVDFRKNTNVTQDSTEFFKGFIPRTTDSLTISGKVWWRYEQLIEITSDPTAVQRVLYVGFELGDEDLMACPKLERGTVHTPWQAEPLQIEELRCQRYFWHWEGRNHVNGPQTPGHTDDQTKFCTMFFPTGMAYPPITRAAAVNPGTFDQTTRWSTNYSETAPSNQNNFIAGLEVSAEFTDFQTWSTMVTG